MGFLEHLEELRKRFFKVIYVFGPVLLFVTTFEVHFHWVATPIPRLLLPVPYAVNPSYLSGFASQAFARVVSDLKPSWVKLTQLTPAEALSVQFKMGLFLTALFTMPWIAYQAWMFVAPALYHKEKALITRIVIPATVLFAAGALFAYRIILPFAIPFLYGLGGPLGVEVFLLQPDDFLDMVLIIMAAMGVAFQTPLIMWGLTGMGLVQPSFWKKYWRFAVIGFFVFGAVVTPDGSGITMVLVALPMTFLYLAGMALATQTARRRKGRALHLGRRTVAVAVAGLLMTGTLGYWVYSTATAPPREQVLGEGHLVLEVPIMAVYSMAPPKEGITTVTRVQVPGTSLMHFAWGNATAGGLPVRFILAPQGPFLQGSPNGFLYRPAGTNQSGSALSLGASGGGQKLFSSLWEMDYRVRRMTLSQGYRSDAWIQLDYTLRQPSPFPVARDLPTGNVTLPALSDLIPAEAKVPVTVAGDAWQYQRSIADFTPPLGRFRHTLPPVVLDGGSAGTLHLQLTSEFSWGKGDTYAISLSGSGDLTMTLDWFWDSRFGALLARPSA